MTKKIILTISFILLALCISTYSFAADEIKNGAMDTANGIRNVVGDAENGVEDAAKDVTGAIREGTNDVEKAGNDVTGDMNTNNATINNSQTDNSYTATRTSTGMFGTSNTMWTWIILAVIAAVIVGLIWYYIAQNNSINNNR